MSEVAAVNRSWWSMAGMAFGAVALVLALFLHGAGPLDPQPTIGQSIGEIAADIGKSAMRGLKGEPQPAPEARAWSLDRILSTSAYVLGGVAVILGVLGFVFRERRRLAFAAVSIGGVAIGFQLFVWTVMIIAGVILIGYILSNLTEILGGFTGG